MTTVVAWLMIGLYVASALLTIAMIGKPRSPITPTSAITGLFTSAAMICAVVYLAWWSA